MPTLGGHSWWANGSVKNAETAFIEDLIPYIEENYKASAQRKDRSIAGLSMGGYGALNLSLSHPDKFCVAGVISPAIYDPFPPATSTSRKAPQLMKDGEFSEEVWTNLLYTSRIENYKQSNDT